MKNRAKPQLALKSGFHWRDVTQLAISGNHSRTLFPDFFRARLGGKPVSHTITDNTWLQTDFIKRIQQRRAAIIKREVSPLPSPPRNE
jgi:malate dehydrogenase